MSKSPRKSQSKSNKRSKRDELAEAAKELRKGVFKGKKVKSYQPAPDGSGMAVVEW